MQYIVWISIPCEGFFSIECNTWDEAIAAVRHNVSDDEREQDKAIKAILKNGRYVTHRNKDGQEEIFITSKPLCKEL